MLSITSEAITATSFLFFILSILIIVVIIFKVTHRLDNSQVILKTTRDQSLINILSNFILLFKLFSVVIVFIFILFLIVAINLNVVEEVKEALVLYLLGLLFCTLFFLFFDQFHRYIFPFLPSNSSTMTLFYHITFDFELFLQLIVAEPLVL